LPDIPTPPVTIRAPEVDEVEVVEAVTDNADENVFAPAIVWLCVVIIPEEPEPATGILNV
jgi:hypothetical protein